MRLRDFIILLIVTGSFSVLSTTLPTRRVPPKTSLKPVNIIWNIYLKDLPTGWRIGRPRLQPPRTDNSAPKERPSPAEKWKFADNNFEYSNNNFGAVEKVRPAENEGKENRVQDDVATHRRLILPRNIIRNPIFCPQGQRKNNGICRFIVSM